MTIFHVFLDETGTHVDGGVVRIAGIMAPHGFWERFNAEWIGILMDAPPVRYWHTNSARVGRLRTCSPDERPLTPEEVFEKEMRLAGIFRRNADCVVGICVSVDVDEFRAHTEGKIKPHKKFSALGIHERFFSDPVFAAMREAVRFSVERANAWNEGLRPGHPLHVWTVFEDSESQDQRQFELTVFVQMLRRMATKSTRRAIGPCIFVPGKGEIGWTTIEAADLYAWHVYNSVRRRQDTHPAWKNALTSIPLQHRMLGAADYTQMVEAINTGERLDVI